MGLFPEENVLFRTCGLYHPHPYIHFPVVAGGDVAEPAVAL
jgi:hypothetical protein